MGLNSFLNIKRAEGALNAYRKVGNEHFAAKDVRRAAPELQSKSAMPSQSRIPN